jgi:hypothetical protein
MNGTLHEAQYTFLITSTSVVVRMRNVLDKFVEKIKPHILHSITFVFENRGVYEIIWKNTVQPSKPQMGPWRMGIARWIPKVTSTHSEYAILIAFPLQQWLHERTSILRYNYTDSLVKLCFKISQKQGLSKPSKREWDTYLLVTRCTNNCTLCPHCIYVLCI